MAYSGSEGAWLTKPPGRLWGASMEQTGSSLDAVGDDRVGATLAVALAAQTLKRRFTEMGRHKGVPYIRPNSAQRYVRIVPCAFAACCAFAVRPRGGNFLEQTPCRLWGAHRNLRPDLLVGQFDRVDHPIISHAKSRVEHAVKTNSPRRMRYGSRSKGVTT